MSKQQLNEDNIVQRAVGAIFNAIAKKKGDALAKIVAADPEIKKHVVALEKHRSELERLVAPMKKTKYGKDVEKWYKEKIAPHSERD